MPTFASAAQFPGVDLFPSGLATGNPTGVDESGYWGSINTSRPDGLKWLAVSLLNGQVICDLPGIVSRDPCRRTLGRYETMVVNVIVTDDTSPSWLAGTRPFAAALIAYRGQPGSEVVYWGGIVLRRKRTLGSNAVELTLATPDCYLDVRNTGAYTTDPGSIGATTDQVDIVADLVAQFCVANQGLPISVTTLPSAGYQRYAVYNDYDDKTVYSNLSALSGLLNGPEWTAHWLWDRPSNTILPVLYVGDHIGFQVPAGLAPRAYFDSANLLDASVEEDYSKGKGANDVTAVSSGQGLARPQAVSPNPPATVLDGRPRVQYRYQPTTSIQDPLTLQQHADHAYALLADGTNTIVLKAAADTYPLLGEDWGLGDDIGYGFDGPAFPGGLSGIARAIGYEASDLYTSPVLYAPTVN